MNKKIQKCIDLQTAFNDAVNPEWRRAGYRWNRAMWIEAGEMADHIGYKWWKNIDAAPAQKQVLLELVDIFHFYLSSLIQSGKRDLVDHIVNNARFAQQHTPDKSKETLLSSIDELVNILTTPGMSDFRLSTDFFRVMYTAGFTIEDVVDYYLGKNALNFFRLNNDYKIGSYVKIWNGKEDNVILDEILQSGDRDFDSITAKLSAAYINATIVK